MKVFSFTIRDVAKRAGVSISTVSRVINGSGYVKPATREKVEKIIQEMGYSPNHVARSLSTGNTKTVGVILPDISNPFFPTLARGIDDAVSSQGYTVIISNTDGDDEEERKAIQVLLDKRVDGIVFVGGSAIASASLKKASKMLPVVLIDREVQDLDCDKVTVNNYRGAYEMTEYLLTKGYKNMAFLSGPSHLSTSRERQAGFLDCLKEKTGATKAPCFVGDYKYDTGYSLAREIIKNGLGIDCLFCANDLMALGAMRCFLDSGIKVPETMGVAGFDDIIISSLVRPALTTVSQPAYRMGTLAAEMLLNRINGRADEKVKEPRETQFRILEPLLVPRDSA